MGEFSKIEWCDHTFNPWIGCQKVSPGCDNCYAETQNAFRKWNGGTWGPHAPRKRTSEANWRKPRQWAKTANGSRPRVFCASLADVFDNKAPDEWRQGLFRLIEETPELDWILLTKRPGNISKMLPTRLYLNPAPNIWLGVTAENQTEAERRVPILLKTPARVRFVSYEPALGEVDWTPWLVERCPTHDFDSGFCIGACPDRLPRLDWIICGGESGPGARMMQTWWADSALAQCRAAGVPFFMKQMTGKKPIPDDLMVREFPAGRAALDGEKP